MAQIESWFSQDLKKPVKVNYLDGNVFSQDNQGNIIGVEVFDGDTPAPLSGTAQAYIIRSDGATVTASGTIDANKVYFAMPEAAYGVPGVVSIALKLASGSVVTTLLSVVAVVYATSTDAAVDPGEIIPSVEDLIDAINAAIEAIPQDYSELQSAAVKTYNTIIATNQSDLNAQGDYADCNTIHANTVVSYYLTNAVLLHCPPIKSAITRAVVLTYTSNPAYTSIAGTVQIWIDVVCKRSWYRFCWESSNTWSEWFDYGSEQNDVLCPFVLTKDNTDPVIVPFTATAGDIVVIEGTFCTLGESYTDCKEQIFTLYATKEDNSVPTIIQNGTFNGDQIVFAAAENYKNFGIAIGSTLRNAMGANDYAVIGFTVHSNKKYSSLAEKIRNANENAGVLTRYKALNAAICKMHHLSANAGDKLTIRPVSANASVSSVTVFGMYTERQADGYDNLGIVNFGEIAEITCSRAYGSFQTWANVPANTNVDTLEIVVDAAINLKPGVQKDVLNIGKRPILNSRTCNIFHKVVCIGDSYTSGHIQTPADPSATGTNENYAYPQFMAQITGNTYINCGISGATAKTWQTGARGLQKAQDTGRVQAYIISLMINDSGLVDGQARLPVGTLADIGTDNDTYYAQMSKIIREVNTISPLAKIFVNTCPKSETDPTRYDPYNTAVRNIVSAYANTYPVFCVDLAADYADLYHNASLTGDYTHDHYTALGYEQFAEIYAYILSDFINSHISAFQDVYKIPYD